MANYSVVKKPKMLISNLWAFYRRIREFNENNLKRFMEERKRQTMKQSVQLEHLKKQHQQQMDKFLLESKKVKKLRRVPN